MGIIGYDRMGPFEIRAIPFMLAPYMASSDYGPYFTLAGRCFRPA